MGTQIKSQNIRWHSGAIDTPTREKLLGISGATLWFTGLSGSGKSTVAVALERLLLEHNRPAYRLDGDNIRHGLNSDLGFSPDERRENIRRISEVSKLFTDSGMLTLVSFISPYREVRSEARRLHQEAGLRFIEVYVNTPLQICEDRDVKGLYQKARAGELSEFTGISAPYEPPLSPEITLDTSRGTAEDAANECLRFLQTHCPALPAPESP